MPLTAYLEIDDIPGESQQVDHEDEIDIWGIEWGLRQATTSAGGRRVRSRTDVRPVALQKFYDAASPYLADAVERGKNFDKAVLTVRKDSGETHLDYLVITMENIVIADYSLQNTERDDPDPRIMERFEIAFEQMAILYRRQLNDGSITEHEVEIRD